MARTEILLDSGTNEVELAEFEINGNRFGINVAKIREFIPFEGLTLVKVPGSPSTVAGMFSMRGRSIPLVDLRAYLELPEGQTALQQVVVVTDFNKMTTAFIADHIHRIHRVSWADFRPLSQYLSATNPLITGTVSLDGKEVLVLDLESIVGDLFPESVINYDQETKQEPTLQEKRAAIKVVFAEDSSVIRNKVTKILDHVGYSNVQAFDNGQTALEALQALQQQAQAAGKPMTDYVNLILTDIEMPKMDGLTLCRIVKQDMRLPVPVVIFSSLINEQMADKCRKMGADAFASKPETESLLATMDSLVLGKKA